MHNELAEAIHLREDGEHEEARNLLLKLVAEHPEEAIVHFQTAWVHDAMGLEREAVAFYERALELGLSNRERAPALLGLGSTLRTLGEYARAIEVLREGVEDFPEMRAMEVFLIMSLYNEGRHQEAMERALQIILDTSADDSIGMYERAIQFYAGNLDQTW